MTAKSEHSSTMMAKKREREFRKRCKNCLKNCPYFVEKFSGTNKNLHTDDSHCQYILMTGRRRDMDPSVCTHYKDKVKKPVASDYPLFLENDIFGGAKNGCKM